MEGAKQAGRALLSIMPAIAGIGVVIWLFVLQSKATTDAGKLAYLAAVVVLGFGVVALVRYALLPVQAGGQLSGPAAEAPEQERVRSRLAPMIVGIGALGITVMAVSMMALLVYLASASGDNQIKGKIDALLNGIFTATLPVLATWVGTVLAFYFTNESFRQAAESTRETFAASMGHTVAAKLWGTPRVVPYDKITKIELPPDATASSPEEAAAKWPLKDFTEIFRTSATASRVIVFDQKRQPILIIRKRRMPLAPADDDKLEAYLKLEDNRADAKIFRFLGVGATLSEARSIVERYKVLDIFITDTGKPNEPVKGWTTDDLLRAGD